MIIRQNVIDLQVHVPLSEVMRMMGCTRNDAVRVEVREVVEEVVCAARELIQPRSVYIVHDVAEISDTRLQLEGCPPVRGPVSGFLRPAERVATFVLTIGSELESRARRHMAQGEMLVGYAWDAVGSAAADLTLDALTQYLLQFECGLEEAVTLPSSPGYCGMGVDQQKTLFSILDAAPIGVKLWPTYIMEPIKSMSGFMGIGPRDRVVEHGVPCQWCDLGTCQMRRHLAREA